MKSTKVNLIFGILIFAQFAPANPMVDAWRRSDLYTLKQMSDNVAEEYAKFAEQALGKVRFSQLGIGTKNPLRAHTVFAPVKDPQDITGIISKFDGDGTLVSNIERMHVTPRGEIIKTKAQIPVSLDRPSKTEILSAGSGDGGGINSSVTVKRTFDQQSTDPLELEQKFSINEIEDGKFYNMISECKVTKGNLTAEVKSGELGQTLPSREMWVKVEISNTHLTPRPRFWGSSKFVLPASIKGNVVTVGINAAGTRLTFKTTEGMEYTYAIEKGTADQFEQYSLNFRQVGAEKILGGKNSLLAKVKVIGRSNKPVKGLDTEPMGSVGSAQ